MEDIHFLSRNIYDQYILDHVLQDNLDTFSSLASKGYYPLFVDKEEQPNIYYLEKIIIHQRHHLLNYVLSKCRCHPIDLNDNMKYYLFTISIKNNDLTSFQLLLESFYPSREILEQLYTLLQSKEINTKFQDIAISYVLSYIEKFRKRGEKRKRSVYDDPDN